MTEGSRAKPRKTKIFLVDDHPLVRRSLRLLVSLERDMVICGESDGGPDALEKVIVCEPDVTIADLRLKTVDGLELIKQLRPLRPRMKILVFTMCDEKFNVERVLRAGVNGYMTKEEATEKLIGVVRLLMEGKTYLSGTVADGLLLDIMNQKAQPDASQSSNKLTQREMEILTMIGNGLGTNEIAEKLRVSVRTVASHREHIKGKLNMRTAPELTSYAYTMVKSDKATDSAEPPEA
jgi:DNA-binding NarL/FixJ family response regulator